MIDIAIDGGEIIDCRGRRRINVLISGGIIVGLMNPSLPLPAASQVVDGAGLLIVPGGIDPHVHADLDVHLPNGEMTAGGDSAALTKAALYGGTTTLVDFAWNDGSEPVADSVARRAERWGALAYCNFGLHVGILNEVTPSRVVEVAAAVKDGFPTVKVFTSNVFPNAPLQFKVSALSIRALAIQLAESGGMLVVHGEDDELVMEGYKRALDAGGGSLTEMSHVHSTLSERLAFARVIDLLDDVDDAKLYFMHVSAKDGVDAIARAQSRGRAVYGETLLQFLLADDSCYSQPGGVVYHTYPSVKGETDRTALWAGITSGTLSTIATDALCTSRSVKLAGQRIDNAVGGGVGIEPRTALMYTEMVVNRGMPEASFVDAVSTNAARLMGMYPQKGSVTIGADADLALLDTSVAVTLTQSFLHESDYTPWEGRHVFGWPKVTILNGAVAMRSGDLLARPGDGRLVRRWLSPGTISARR